MFIYWYTYTCNAYTYIYGYVFYTRALTLYNIFVLNSDVGDIQKCSSGIERSDWRKALKVELNNQAIPPLRTIALDTGADLEFHGYDILLSSMYDQKSRLQPLRVLEIGVCVNSN